jgi:hypothetical protein
MTIKSKMDTANIEEGEYALVQTSVKEAAAESEEGKL